MIEVEQICDRLGYAPATAYRYIRELNEVGLLARLPGGYALGPRVIQLDLQMRESNPILIHSRDVIEQLVRETGMMVLLSELYEDTVISIHQEFGTEPLKLNFGRGRPMDLFRSSTSRIILAHLSPRRMKSLYEKFQESADVKRLGSTWKEFSRVMLSLRKDGYSRSTGELNANVTGLAAPIFDDKSRVIGSITLVAMSERYGAFNDQFLARLICNAAAEITTRIGPAAMSPAAI